MGLTIDCSTVNTILSQGNSFFLEKEYKMSVLTVVKYFVQPYMGNSIIHLHFSLCTLWETLTRPLTGCLNGIRQ